MALPVPFYQDAFVTLFNADARDILPQLPDLSVGVAVIDPPQRDGVLADRDAIMAQVRPDLIRICTHVIEMIHMVPVHGTGQQKNDWVANNCDFTMDGTALPTARVNDPDMKAPGWTNILASDVAAGLSILDCFSGAGGWILLAAKRAGRQAIGIELNSDYCTQSAARIAIG